MNRNHHLALHIIIILLMILWTYTAASKAMDLRLFEVQMNKQVLFPFLKKPLVYLLPPAEALIAVLLLFDSSRFTGLYASAGLLLVFSVYVALAVFRVFERVPCSCGGILRTMGWGTHLVFNVFFLLLTMIAINLNYRERRESL
ncbi:hypothetical protein KHS38_14110 [Mucilaginibacter sp. Bleaf8]|uniref:MauE/DoxX family redox-associated membrane protein n=1 Tax=Mucilaginibacter sp. Bleaf8 TaxID=2834430 RepID=UPI001BCDC20B|nr:MauE/DoxX family redox-associated membrane protein [Mucilaginibacter sp. Bleaf8]MBS7565543.1 hypothetical protein [Mucilaginibacter sp. Bleaf8]